LLGHVRIPIESASLKPSTGFPRLITPTMNAA
jgi:hypothetical protein